MAIRTLVDDKKSEMSNFLGEYILTSGASGCKS